MNFAILLLWYIYLIVHISSVFPFMLILEIFKLCSFTFFPPFWFFTGSIQENEPAWSEQTRRDMLSLNVEFVKINISRSRKIDRSSDKEIKSNIVRFSGTRQNLYFSAVCVCYTELFLVYFRSIDMSCMLKGMNVQYM